MATREGSTGLVPAPALDRSRWPLHMSLSRRESIWGYVFISPWIFGFLAFTALPMIASLFFSVTDYDPRFPDTFHFIGLANYEHMLHDPLVVQSLTVTVKFAVLAVPVTLIVALGVAMLVNNKLLIGRSVFRTLFYMPTQIPLIASTIIWLGALSLRTGWFNMALGVFGIEGPSWFTDPNWVTPGLVLLGLWGIGNMMLIFLAGLQGVPTELYEAARVDGAGRWTLFRHVTLPMISPVILYNLIISLIAAFQYFTQAYVISNGTGDPNNATLFFNLDLYREGWRYYNMGYASALAWLLFAIVMGLTVGLFRTARYWVYEGSTTR
ncbi:MAG: multiple sugar transport system permease protein [Chloroflexota bacterium]|jgi:multiple sugar transport system permease protein|nr:multiple sugar transport system permease protein [Chloroflexota bacterium]